MSLIRTLAVALVIVYSVTSFAGSKEHKFQDGEYNRYICKNILNGKTEVTISKQSRVDCMGEAFVAEIEFADLWRQGVSQVLRYSKESKKDGILYIVIENEQEKAFVDKANEYLQENNLENVMSIRVFDSNDMALTRAQRPCVKKTRSSICHAINAGSHGATRYFKAFSSMAECVSSGGRRARNASIEKMNKGLMKENCPLIEQ